MNAFIHCPSGPQALRDAERERQRYAYLIHSLEAKLDRVEPEGPDYWDTITRIEAAQDAIQQAACRCIALRLHDEKE